MMNYTQEASGAAIEATVVVLEPGELESCLSREACKFGLSHSVACVGQMLPAGLVAVDMAVIVTQEQNSGP